MRLGYLFEKSNAQSRECESVEKLQVIENGVSVFDLSDVAMCQAAMTRSSADGGQIKRP